MTASQIAVPGGRLHVVDEGYGPPIVLIHAGVADLRAWDDVVRPLNHAGYRVIRHDVRGFGFSGGHFHNGWGNNDQRKLVLNAILWTANADVPASGVESKVSEEELAANQDPKPASKPKAPAPAK